jgi:hypothetical protein
VSTSLIIPFHYQLNVSSIGVFQYLHCLCFFKIDSLERLCVVLINVFVFVVISIVADHVLNFITDFRLEY